MTLKFRSGDNLRKGNTATRMSRRIRSCTLRRSSKVLRPICIARNIDSRARDNGLVGPDTPPNYRLADTGPWLRKQRRPIARAPVHSMDPWQTRIYALNFPHGMAWSYLSIDSRLLAWALAVCTRLAWTRLAWSRIDAANSISAEKFCAGISGPIHKGRAALCP